jgi:GNAT superfamily N-acetyltransferase
MEEGGVVVGSTSFSLSLPPTMELARVANEVCYGHGVEVDPALQGTGRGWRLAEARHQVVRDMGAKLFLGMTWASNAPMLRIFEKQGLTRHADIPGAYPHNDPPVDGIMFVGKP